MVTKSHISGWLRRSGLLSTAEYIRYRFHQLRHRKQNHIFRKSHPEIALPPDFFIYETYRLNCSEYYYDGYETAKEIISVLGRATDLNKKRGKILDWGCGPGRVVRHLPALLPEALIFGTDYNQKYITWCRKNLKGIVFDSNGVNPPLNYEDDFFDGVIGISVFTHLSPDNHYAWMNELYRILKPGGAAFITTQGAAYRSIMLQEEKDRFDRGELVIRENVYEGNRLYSSFQPEKFILQLAGEKFEVTEFCKGNPDTSGPEQDQWVLRKKI